MQLCFYFPALKNKQNNAIFGNMYESFFEGIRSHGVKVKLVTDVHAIDGDILITNIGSGYEKTAAQAMNHFKGPVILNIYNAYITFNRPFLKRWNNRILFAYNPDYAQLNYSKYGSIEIPYLHLPLASDPAVFKPLNIEKEYDIVFLGNGNSGFGREKYIRKLVEFSEQNNLKIFLAGYGWDKYGFPYRIVKHGNDTNLIYNQSKVCINIHNDRQFAGIEKEMDANNRLFDLAMAGCCQVSNGQQMITKYFSTNEVAAADDPDQWIRLVQFYLNNEVERNKMAENARKKAIEEHTWQKRGETFVSFINEYYANYQLKDQSVGMFTKLGRYLDQYKAPAYQYKEIRLVRCVLLKLGLYVKK